jgi:hypothetical protein
MTRGALQCPSDLDFNIFVVARSDFMEVVAQVPVLFWDGLRGSFLVLACLAIVGEWAGWSTMAPALLRKR